MLNIVWILLIGLLYSGCGRHGGESIFGDFVRPTLERDMTHTQALEYWKNLCDKDIKACALLFVDPTIDDQEQYLQSLQEILKHYQNISNLYKGQCHSAESSAQKQACEVMAYASYKLWYSIYYVGYHKLNLQDSIQSFAKSLNISLPQPKYLQDYVRKACADDFFEPCLLNMAIPIVSAAYYKTPIDEAEVFAMRNKILQLTHSQLKADNSDIAILSTLLEMYRLLESYYQLIEAGSVSSATLNKQKAKKAQNESARIMEQYTSQLCKAGMQSACARQEYYEKYKEP